MRRHLIWVAGLTVGGLSGCCLEATSGRSFDSSSVSGAGASTGSSSASSTGTSTGGSTTGFTGPFRGSVQIERLASETDLDGGVTVLLGRFLMASDWPDCDPDTFFDNGKVSCCFRPAGPQPPVPSAGVLSLALPLDDGGVSTEWIAPAADGGYDAAITRDSQWFSAVAGSGGDVPAFDLDPLGYFEGPPPVLTPPLSELTSLPTNQAWIVPLTPSNFEFVFWDTVELEVDGVGSVICGTGDEAGLTPIGVPSGLLANLAGHQGTVTITRDDFRGLLDAGPELRRLGIRVGVRVQSAVGGVSFTP